jgi:hypothetical protein
MTFIASWRNPAGQPDRCPSVRLSTDAWHNAIGLGWVMVCFAVISVLAVGFVYRWLPETKGLSVEEAVSVFDRQADAKQTAA